MSLRPKYTLNREAVQGDRYTINAVGFSQLTSRHYPYPRIGTRAPNGMFPRSGTRARFVPGNGLPLPTGHLAPRNIPGPLSPKFQLGNGLSLPRGRVAPMMVPGALAPKFQLGNGTPHYDDGGPLVRMPWGYVEPGPIVKVGSLKPKYTLNKTEVQGVMPASTYMRMTGKRTTEFTLPPVGGGETVISAPISAPSLVEYDSLFWGTILGVVATLGMVYGVIPALAEAGAKAIRKR